MQNWIFPWLLLLFPTVLYSQTDSTQLGISVGIYTGMELSVLQLGINENFTQRVTDKFTVESSGAIGFALGICLNKSYHARLEQQFNFGMKVNNAVIEYQFADLFPSTKHIMPISGEATTMLNYYLEKRDDLSLLAGAGLLVEIPTPRPTITNMRAADFLLKVGLGKRIKNKVMTSHFELIYSRSMVNLLVESESIYSQTLTRVQKYYISIIYRGY